MLRRDDSTPLKQALVAAGFTDILSLVSLTEDQIDDLKVNEEKLVPGDYNLVKLFIMFQKYRQLLGTAPITNDEYTAISRADYDRFRVDEIDDYNKLIISVSIVTANTPATTVGTMSTNVLNTPAEVVASPACSFKRGMECDQIAYLELKKEELNGTWHSSVETQAYAQDISNVLDPSYTPVGQEFIDAKLGALRGSTEGFVTHWQNQIRLYEHLCEANNGFSGG